MMLHGTIREGIIEGFEFKYGDDKNIYRLIFERIIILLCVSPVNWEMM